MVSKELFLKLGSWILALTYFGGFSTVRYVLKSAMSFCIPVSELGKFRSERQRMVRSIQARRSEAIVSYSSFMFSMSTMIPMIWRGGGGGGGVMGV